MELDRIHNKKRRKQSESKCFGLESLVYLRIGRLENAQKRSVIKEIAKEGKTWSEIKKFARNRVWLNHFVDAIWYNWIVVTKIKYMLTTPVILLLKFKSSFVGLSSSSCSSSAADFLPSCLFDASCADFYFLCHWVCKKN